jgi:DNA-binding FrmR family transcriptional regulator
MDGWDPEVMTRRLHRIEGQVRGVERMLTEGRECEDILTQLMAVRSGLEQVSLLLLDHHVRDCLLAECDVDVDRLEGLRQTLRLWARFGAPATQLPD